MSSPSSDHQYYLSSDKEMNPESYQWIEPISIDDDDLMFGGKSLSTWYEEDRSRLSGVYSDEEERRGRQRHRTCYASSHSSSKTQQSSKKN
ncbi:hypothetical protein jhhlp_000451 [Lomentospora prolificans]|uniref:Uncharacterized protein n=1 Tax=Lomentospora prolificans TaxID=41688 RepID=A0A2N3NL15_9PEZI|nr:hypothetical protein jhhlp_000451 [Lomentospora prolificans]